jgi:hypothetical protein
LRQLDLQAFAMTVVLDRNSQVVLH